LPATEVACRQVLSLPFGPYLTTVDTESVVDALANCLSAIQSPEYRSA
jgi:dTDP-4-amino-4,6-dideoxygalactose transaminase